MKRLQCLYRPNKDKNYPWALKHPKVESPLALFKTRKDAMTWFLSLGYECATWFQTDKKIWGGIVIEFNDEDSKGNIIPEFELNVDKFDGGLDYEETVEELAIDPKSMKRDDKAAKRNLKEVVDFKIIKDHETYFPADDDYVYERKKSAKDLEIEKLQNELSKKEQLEKEVNELQEKLANSVTKEVLVEKFVEKDVEVLPVCEDKITEYAYIRDLMISDQIKVLAIYARKLRLTAASLPETLTSIEDIKRIETNFENVLKAAKALKKDVKGNEEYKELLAAIVATISKAMQEFADKVKGSEEIEFNAETEVYSVCELVGNITLAQKTSYVLFNNLHVGFVKKDSYDYSIFLGEEAQRQHFLVFESVLSDGVVSAEGQVVTTRSRASLLAIFLIVLGYSILIVLAILLGLGYII
ncbi:hypothetical protein VBM90_00280 [Mycoplasma sp. 2704]|uniref:MAG3090 family protein n=1 Tax=unclassified Mycoplasma TaxID=2683645 RepID=UPI002B1DCC01|nr:MULTISPECIES: hypothetical protein [unclassified Mycoplasma]MEA4134245.1 hypothetical protein [Mycoplasma sp. 2704]MEA4333529.1 hypothetical protein [Mycoplasma sp. 1232]